MSEQDEAGVREPFPCTACGLPLPIDVREEKQAVSLVCRGCGARYRGALWEPMPEDLRGNAHPAPARKQN